MNSSFLGALFLLTSKSASLVQCQVQPEETIVSDAFHSRLASRLLQSVVLSMIHSDVSIEQRRSHSISNENILTMTRDYRPENGLRENQRIKQFTGDFGACIAQHLKIAATSNLKSGNDFLLPPLKVKAKMKIFKENFFFPVRRDVTAPTSVVYITRIVSTNTAVNQPSEGNPTVTVLKTITAGSAASAVATTEIPSLITYTESIPHPASSTVAASKIYFAALSTTIPEITTTASLPLSAAVTLLLSSNILSNSSTRLGLAIGIPIAVVSVFGLVVFFLIYLRKRMDMNPEEEIAFKARKTENMKTALKKHSVSSMYLTSDLEQGRDTKLLSYTSYKNQQYTSEAKPNFLKRISRLMNIPDSPMEFKSPVFLRRFHLLSNKNEAQTVLGQAKVSPNSPLSQVIHNSQNPYEINDDKVEPNLPQWESFNLPACPELTYVVVKPYARRLGDELSVCIGEKVTIVDHHSDGWATVKMVDSGDIGVIPLMCIKKVLSK